MKRISIFFLIVIIIVVGISYLYLNYKTIFNNAQKENKQFESYYGQEIYGSDIATIINKAVDNNEKNEVEKCNNYWSIFWLFSSTYASFRISSWL